MASVTALPYNREQDAWVCALCKLLGPGFALGLGGFLTRPGSKGNVHLTCALFAPRVVDTGTGRLLHLNTEISRGNKLTCAHCHRLGATIGCAPQSCDKSFHLPCAAAVGCVFDVVRHVGHQGGLFCTSHASVPEARSAIAAADGKPANWLESLSELTREIAHNDELRKSIENAATDDIIAFKATQSVAVAILGIGVRYMTSEQLNTEQDRLISKTLDAAKCRGQRCSACTAAFRATALTSDAWMPPALPLDDALVGGALIGASQQKHHRGRPSIHRRHRALQTAAASLVSDLLPASLWEELLDYHPAGMAAVEGASPSAKALAIVALLEGEGAVSSSDLIAYKQDTRTAPVSDAYDTLVVDTDDAWWLSSAAVRCHACGCVVHSGCHSVPQDFLIRYLKALSTWEATSGLELPLDCRWLCDNCKSSSKSQRCYLCPIEKDESGAPLALHPCTVVSKHWERQHHVHLCCALGAAAAPGTTRVAIGGLHDLSNISVFVRESVDEHTGLHASTKCCRCKSDVGLLVPCAFNFEGSSSREHEFVHASCAMLAKWHTELVRPIFVDSAAAYEYEGGILPFTPETTPVCTFCSCSESYNRFMIMCDSCQLWYHGDCVGYLPGEVTADESFLCPSCAAGRVPSEAEIEANIEKSNADPSALPSRPRSVRLLVNTPTLSTEGAEGDEASEAVSQANDGNPAVACLLFRALAAWGDSLKRCMSQPRDLPVDKVIEHAFAYYRLCVPFGLTVKNRLAAVAQLSRSVPITATDLDLALAPTVLTEFISTLPSPIAHLRSAADATGAAWDAAAFREGLVRLYSCVSEFVGGVARSSGVGIGFVEAVLHCYASVTRHMLSVIEDGELLLLDERLVARACVVLAETVDIFRACMSSLPFQVPQQCIQRLDELAGTVAYLQQVEVLCRGEADLHALVECAMSATNSASRKHGGTGVYDCLLAFQLRYTAVAVTEGSKQRAKAAEAARAADEPPAARAVTSRGRLVKSKIRYNEQDADDGDELRGALADDQIEHEMQVWLAAASRADDTSGSVPKSAAKAHLTLDVHPIPLLRTFAKRCIDALQLLESVKFVFSKSVGKDNLIVQERLQGLVTAAATLQLTSREIAFAAEMLSETRAWEHEVETVLRESALDLPEKSSDTLVPAIRSLLDRATSLPVTLKNLEALCRLYQRISWRFRAKDAVHRGQEWLASHATSRASQVEVASILEEAPKDLTPEQQSQVRQLSEWMQACTASIQDMLGLVSTVKPAAATALPADEAQCYQFYAARLSSITADKETVQQILTSLHKLPIRTTEEDVWTFTTSLLSWASDFYAQVTAPRCELQTWQAALRSLFTTALLQQLRVPLPSELTEASSPRAQEAPASAAQQQQPAGVLIADRLNATRRALVPLPIDRLKQILHIPERAPLIDSRAADSRELGARDLVRQLGATHSSSGSAALSDETAPFEDILAGRLTDRAFQAGLNVYTEPLRLVEVDCRSVACGWQFVAHIATDAESLGQQLLAATSVQPPSLDDMQAVHSDVLAIGGQGQGLTAAFVDIDDAGRVLQRAADMHLVSPVLASVLATKDSAAAWVTDMKAMCAAEVSNMKQSEAAIVVLHTRLRALGIFSRPALQQFAQFVAVISWLSAVHNSVVAAVVSIKECRGQPRPAAISDAAIGQLLETRPEAPQLADTWWANTKGMVTFVLFRTRAAIQLANAVLNVGVTFAGRLQTAVDALSGSLVAGEPVSNRWLEELCSCVSTDFWPGGATSLEDTQRLLQTCAQMLQNPARAHALPFIVKRELTDELQLIVGPWQAEMKSAQAAAVAWDESYSGLMTRFQSDATLPACLAELVALLRQGQRQLVAPDKLHDALCAFFWLGTAAAVEFCTAEYQINTNSGSLPVSDESSSASRSTLFQLPLPAETMSQLLLSDDEKAASVDAPSVAATITAVLHPRQELRATILAQLRSWIAKCEGVLHVPSEVTDFFATFSDPGATIQGLLDDPLLGLLSSQDMISRLRNAGAELDSWLRDAAELAPAAKCVLDDGLHHASVGADTSRHVELSRTLVTRCNEAWALLLRLPQRCALWAVGLVQKAAVLASLDECIAPASRDFLSLSTNVGAGTLSCLPGRDTVVLVASTFLQLHACLMLRWHAGFPMIKLAPTDILSDGDAKPDDLPPVAASAGLFRSWFRVPLEETSAQAFTAVFDEHSLSLPLARMYKDVIAKSTAWAAKARTALAAGEDLSPDLLRTLVNAHADLPIGELPFCLRSSSVLQYLHCHMLYTEVKEHPRAAPFTAGQDRIVWAKYRGFPFWPAQLSDPRAAVSVKVDVTFFGSHPAAAAPSTAAYRAAVRKPHLFAFKDGASPDRIPLQSHEFLEAVTQAQAALAAGGTAAAAMGEAADAKKKEKKQKKEKKSKSASKSSSHPQLDEGSSEEEREPEAKRPRLASTEPRAAAVPVAPPAPAPPPTASGLSAADRLKELLRARANVPAAVAQPEATPSAPPVKQEAAPRPVPTVVPPLVQATTAKPVNAAPAPVRRDTPPLAAAKPLARPMKTPMSHAEDEVARRKSRELLTASLLAGFVPYPEVKACAARCAGEIEGLLNALHPVSAARQQYATSLKNLVPWLKSPASMPARHRILSHYFDVFHILRASVLSKDALVHPEDLSWQNGQGAAQLIQLCGGLRGRLSSFIKVATKVSAAPAAASQLSEKRKAPEAPSAMPPEAKRARVEEKAAPRPPTAAEAPRPSFFSFTGGASLADLLQAPLPAPVVSHEEAAAGAGEAEREKAAKPGKERDKDKDKDKSGHKRKSATKEAGTHRGHKEASSVLTELPTRIVEHAVTVSGKDVDGTAVLAKRIPSRPAPHRVKPPPRAPRLPAKVQVSGRMKMAEFCDHVKQVHEMSSSRLMSLFLLRPAADATASFSSFMRHLGSDDRVAVCKQPSTDAYVYIIPPIGTVSHPDLLSKPGGGDLLREIYCYCDPPPVSLFDGVTDSPVAAAYALLEFKPGAYDDWDAAETTSSSSSGKPPAGGQRDTTVKAGAPDEALKQLINETVAMCKEHGPGSLALLRSQLPAGDAAGASLGFLFPDHPHHAYFMSLLPDTFKGLPPPAAAAAVAMPAALPHAVSSQPPRSIPLAPPNMASQPPRSFLNTTTSAAADPRRMRAGAPGPAVPMALPARGMPMPDMAAPVAFVPSAPRPQSSAPSMPMSAPAHALPAPGRPPMMIPPPAHYAPAPPPRPAIVAIPHHHPTPTPAPAGLAPPPRVDAPRMMSGGVAALAPPAAPRLQPPRPPVAPAPPPPRPAAAAAPGGWGAFAAKK